MANTAVHRPTTHPRLDGVSAEQPCSYCGLDVWWDDATETYEDATEEFRCEGEGAPHGGHSVA